MFSVCQIFEGQISFRSCTEPLYERVIVTAAISAIISLILPRKAAHSTTIIWIVFITHFVSSLAVSSVVVEYSFQHTFFLVLWTAVFALASRLSTLISFQVPRIRFSRTLFTILIVFLFSFVFLSVYMHFGFENIPSLFDVYGRRSEYKKDIYESNSIIIGYIITIGGFSVAPIIMIYAYKAFSEKNYLKSSLLFIMSFIISLIIFSATGLKSVAFSSFAILAFSTFLNKKGYEVDRFFSVFSLFLMAIFAIYIYDMNNFIFSHLFRRVFLMPGMVTNFYMDFIGLWNIDSLEKAPLVIDKVYFNSDGSANSGTIGSGLAMYGTAGIAMNIIIICVCLIFVDNLTKHIKPYISMSVFVPAAYAFSNSAQTTVILSYGLMVTTIILYLSDGEFGRNSALLKERPRALSQEHK